MEPAELEKRLFVTELLRALGVTVKGQSAADLFEAEMITPFVKEDV